VPSQPDAPDPRSAPGVSDGRRELRRVSEADAPQERARSRLA